MAAPAGNYQQRGGWVWSENLTPPQIPPPPSLPGWSGGPPGWGGPSQDPLYQGGGRGQASSGGKMPNPVTRIKAEIRVCRPGQLLELARFVAGELSKRSPELYAQFLSGLGAGSAPGGEVESSAVALVLSDRKARWKAMCEADGLVCYYREVVAAIRQRHGKNADVDTLATKSEDVDVRKFFLGRARREELLGVCGLARQGSALVPLTSSPKDEVASQIDESEERKGPGEESDRLAALEQQMVALARALSMLAQPSTQTTTTTAVVAESSPAASSQQGAGGKQPAKPPAEAIKMKGG